MAKKTITVGLIGYQFMGKAHSNAYRQVGRYFDIPYDVRMKTICGRTEDAVRGAAHEYGWEGYETDWRKVIEDPEIDIIDIVTPGNTHAEMAIAAAEAGKIVFCEKPIGNTLREAQDMYDAVQKAGVPSAVFHNYRKAPALSLAKRMIEEGKLGDLYHFRAVYLQDFIVDPDFPMIWRLDKDVAGSGTLGDLGAHLIDSARFLVGEFAQVSGQMKTFIKQRPTGAKMAGKLGAGVTAGSQEMAEVTVDDTTSFLAQFQNGVMGTFESSRFATGRKNHKCVEVNGSKGSVVFNLERMNELEYYNAEDPEDYHGFRTIQATEANHPYMENYWPVAHIIGYEHTFLHVVADALNAIHKGEPCAPDFGDGLANQKVLDAVEKSSESGQWVKL
ncbi:MAG: Gfo/Idh/MocA family protein [Fimbriimonadaceae bacterium]